MVGGRMVGAIGWQPGGGWARLGCHPANDQEPGHGKVSKMKPIPALGFDADDDLICWKRSAGVVGLVGFMLSLLGLILKLLWRGIELVYPTMWEQGVRRWPSMTHSSAVRDTGHAKVRAWCKGDWTLVMFALGAFQTSNSYPDGIEEAETVCCMHLLKRADV